MWNLFGSKKKKKEEVVEDPTVTMGKINNQIESIEKRQKLLDTRCKSLTAEALKKKKEKNTRAAVLALKKKKMLEQELNKIDGMKMILEQQKLSLEGAAFDSDIFQALSGADKAIKAQQKDLNIDKFEELKDSMDEQNELQNEIKDFFGNMALEDQDELMDELEQLEAENALEGLEDDEEELEVSNKKIAGPAQPAPVKQKQKEQQDENQLLADLMA